MKPAAPVTTNLDIRKLPTPNSQLPNSDSARSFWKLGVGGWELSISNPSLEEPADEREPHDLEVEGDGPVLDVIQVVLDPLLERRVAPPAVDLRPAGDS